MLKRTRTCLVNYFVLTTDNENSALSSFRALRYIRILKLFKPTSFIGRFTNFIVVSLRDLGYYTVLLSFFILLFSVAGREIFANRIIRSNPYDSFGFKLAELTSPRENFDTVINSIITVFILFIGDVKFFYLIQGWTNIMNQYRLYFPQTSVIYFILLIIVGNIMLFNIFLSIMMTNYDQEYAVKVLEHGKLTN